jgi:hypothetical protein
MKKQYFNLFTAVFVSIMLLTTSMVFAEDSTATTEDELIAQDAFLEESIEALNVLGILKGYEDGTFKPNNNITRAEFSAVITRVLGLEEIVDANKGVTPFSDVAADHWATGNINIAYNMGIIAGYGNDMFGPEDPVTYEQATKMIVCALGYEEFSEQRGGYPDGYLASAAQNGVTKGVQGQKGEPANRGIVAKLMFNSLTADIMERSGYGEGATYRVATGKNLLNQNLNVEEGVGQLTANDEVSLLGAAKMRRDEVEIDGKIFNVGETDAKDLLGYRVRYFAEINPVTSLATLIHIREDRDSTSMIIKAEDIEYYSNGVIEYWENKNDYQPRELTIGTNARIFVNGEQVSSFEQPDSGQILLVDSENSGSFDVVFVTSYETYVVERVNTSTHVVTAKFNKGTIDLNERNNNYRVTIIKDGQEIETKDIRQDDVLSIAKREPSAGQEGLWTVMVARNKVSGNVTEVAGGSDDAGLKPGDLIKVNNKEYEVLVDMSNQYTTAISVGDRVDLYLNTEGRIAGINRTSSASQNYAYLIGVEEQGGVGGVVRFRMYTDAGSLRTLEGASTIYYDGERLDAGIVADEVETNQLINFETNSSGQLSRIELPLDNTDGDNRYDLQNFSLDYANEDALYRSSGTIFEGQFKKTSSTKIIYVPLDETDTNSYKRTATFVDSKRYSIEVYDADRVGNIGVLLVRQKEGSSANIVPNEAFVVVERIISAAGNEGDYHRLVGYRSGTDFEINAKDDIVLEDLNTGDIIQFAKDGSDRIDMVDILFTIPSSGSAERTDYKTTKLDNNGRTVYAEVITVDYTSQSILVTGDKNYDISSAKTYIIEETSSGIEIEIGDPDNVTEDDIVFMRTSLDGNKVHDMAILRYRN